MKYTPVFWDLVIQHFRTRLICTGPGEDRACICVVWANLMNAAMNEVISPCAHGHVGTFNKSKNTGRQIRFLGRRFWNGVWVKLKGVGSETGGGLKLWKQTLLRRVFITQSDADQMPEQVKITRKKSPEANHLKLSELKWSVFYCYINNRACLCLPVADLCPPETGHSLFQVLPQVSDVLHCPHASCLWILSWRRKFDTIYRRASICALTSAILLHVSTSTTATTDPQSQCWQSETRAMN